MMDNFLFMIDILCYKGATNVNFTWINTRIRNNCPKWESNSRPSTLQPITRRLHKTSTLLTFLWKQAVFKEGFYSFYLASNMVEFLYEWYLFPYDTSSYVPILSDGYVSSKIRFQPLCQRWVIWLVILDGENSPST